MTGQFYARRDVPAPFGHRGASLDPAIEDAIAADLFPLIGRALGDGRPVVITVNALECLRTDGPGEPPMDIWGRTLTILLARPEDARQGEYVPLGSIPSSGLTADFPGGMWERCPFGWRKL